MAHGTPDPRHAPRPAPLVVHDALGTEPLTGVICIPTYRRPAMLEAALASVLSQQCRNAFGIVVVDNDGADRAGAAQAMAQLGRYDVPHAVLIEPAQGNCKAYNAAWSFVRARLPETPFVLGIDDDEEAKAGWLAALLEAAAGSGADIIGGPVTPIFEADGMEHLRLHPVFRSHYHADGPVPQLYSSANYLIRSAWLDRMGAPYLDERFDYTGGGDTDFFTRSRHLGARFHWTMGAALSETMPARRTEWSWIHARALRNGMISALIERKADPSWAGHGRRIAKSLALLAAAPWRGLRDGARAGSLWVGLYHAQVALGRLGAEFGLAIEQYRKPDAN